MEVSRFTLNERRARYLAAMGALLFALGATAGALAHLERVSRAAVAAADAGWRKSSTTHERVWSELVEVCNARGPDERLTVGNCDLWTVAEAKKRWGIDVRDDLLALRASEGVARGEAVNKAPLAVRWLVNLMWGTE
jgi:hypothetical protein